MSDNGPYLTYADKRPPALPDSAAAERLQDALEAAYAPHTRRAYRAAWRAWCEWAAAHGARELPADPEAVALWLASRADAGASVSTLRTAGSALAAAHRLAGFDSPTAATVVVQAQRGLARQLAWREE